MKRNTNLQELSRDHHHGLLLGWKVRQGLKRGVDPQKIYNYIHYFWDQALSPHFLEEEEILLAYLEDNNELKIQTLTEHSEIAHLVQAASTLQTAEQLLHFAALLDKHIRFEERTLFPYLEMKLTAEELDKIGLAMTEQHNTFKEEFHDEFWKDN